MPLTTGQPLGTYEILGPLGAGGMGEVYRARDTRLEREVAIKVLPEHLADDEERLRRFEREAKTLASLNHPGIAGIHGIGQEGNTRFLAMELVPGEDLAERIARGPLALDEVVDIGQQIADALAAAHDSGVVHRDLKPANVRVTPEGVVKLLDFGLAKAVPRTEAGGGPSTAAKPDSFRSTEAGLVLGTPTYMAPEQARGRPVDRRADAWAFGCVLYECLTGRRAFEGGALADVLAAIMDREPDLGALPAGTPARLRELLRRTLAKDPRRRLQHLGDARLELEELAREPEPGRSAPDAHRHERPWLAALGLGLAVGAVATFAALRGGGGDAETGVAPPPRFVRASVSIDSLSGGVFPRLAPDGSALAVTLFEPGPDGSQRRTLYLRSLDEVEPLRLPGTEEVATLSFSPDGDSLAVVVSEGPGSARLRVLRIELGGGTPRSTPVGGHPPDPNLSSAIAWTDTDELVMTGNRQRLLRLPVEGGAWEEVQLSGLEGFEDYTPDVYRALPGGRHVLATTFAYAAGGFESWVLAIDVETGVAERVVQGGQAAFFPPATLLFSRGETLYATRFDPESRAVEGTPRLLFDGLRTSESWRPGWFDVSRDGTLVHLPGGRQGTARSLVVGGADGGPVPWSGDRRAFDGMLRIARDGSFFTVGVAAPSGLIQTWGSEVDTPLLRPLLAGRATDFMPGAVDGERDLVYFTRLSSDEDEGVWRAPIESPDRAQSLWAPGARRLTAMALTPEGDGLYLRVGDEDGDQLVELLLPPAGTDPGEVEVREHFPIDSDAWSVDLSPGGRWISYSSVVDGTRSIVVRRRREDGAFGPAIPVQVRGPAVDRDNGAYWWSAWSTQPDDEGPSLLIHSGDGDQILRVNVLGSGARPEFSEAEVVTSVASRELVDFAGLADGRVLMVLRGEEELGADRVELVLGLEALLAD